MKKLLWRIARPLLRAFVRLTGAGDPWERFPFRVPLTRFGRGSVRAFSWYFDGPSAVQVGCIDDVCTWLLRCEYLGDRELFNEHDFWQHPRTFEHLRKGDCEDYALWAWRKLTELGLEAELVSGIWAPPGEKPGAHVWLLFQRDGRHYVFEPVARTQEKMIRPLDTVRGEYIPHVGVDRRFQSYAYHGYLRSL